MAENPKNVNEKGAEETTESSKNDDERPKDRFKVRQVNFTGPPEIVEPEEPAKSENVDETANEGAEPEQPESPHGENFTHGYATNEAVPMTMFYRNSSSYNEPHNKRPTLQELRRGLDNDSPLQVNCIMLLLIYFIKLYLINDTSDRIENVELLVS